MKQLIIIIMLFMATLPFGSRAAELSQRDRADISRIESWLNERKTLQADFIQVNDSGEFRSGTLAISRPGKLRVSYKKEDNDKAQTADFMVADGSMVSMWDAAMQDTTSMPQRDHLASFLLRDPVKIGTDVKVKEITRRSGTIEVSLVFTAEPENGTLTLVFDDKPLRFVQWRVRDPAGRVTSVTLQNARDNVTLPADMFYFHAPIKVGRPQNPLATKEKSAN